MKKQYGVYDKMSRIRVSPLFQDRREARQWMEDNEADEDYFEVSYINH